MNIIADATLPDLEIFFPQPFKLQLYHAPEQLPPPKDSPCALLCRSTLTVDAQLLQQYNFTCIATATSGINHIDTKELTKRQIPLFDAKGANASSVADYILATLAYLQHTEPVDIQSAGIIGVGYVGEIVAARLQQLGLKTYCYDPIRAQIDPTFNSCDFDCLYDCELICIHANLHNTHPFPSLSLLDKNFFNKVHHNMTVINAARGGIVNETDLLNTKANIRYCTDVYLNEPTPSTEIIQRATTCTPHIAGHTIEAKKQAVMQLSMQLHNYYNLPMPKIEITHKKQLITNKNWEKTILDWYSPCTETILLKNADDITTAFQEVRKNHQALAAFPYIFAAAK